jgi:benzoyl-CoA reductase/2-hydroxyglutaryl-CoA dehydratase subunit BcrC/BadD/HgdB
VAALAARYLARGLCPAKHGGLEARAGNLVRLARATAADGVVLVTLKFCDPHAFDLPHLAAALDAQGIPYLLVEIEEGNGTGGQLRTRLEAFVERL